MISDPYREMPGTKARAPLQKLIPSVFVHVLFSAGVVSYGMIFVFPVVYLMVLMNPVQQPGYGEGERILPLLVTPAVLFSKAPLNGRYPV